LLDFFYLFSLSFDDLFNFIRLNFFLILLFFRFISLLFDVFFCLDSFSLFDNLFFLLFFSLDFRFDCLRFSLNFFFLFNDFFGMV
jgi:hypothetical protein